MATNELIAYFVVAGDDASLERQYLKIETEYSISVSGSTAVAVLTSKMYVHRDSYGTSAGKKAGDCYITIGGTKKNVIASNASLPALGGSGFVQIGEAVKHTITYDAGDSMTVDIAAQFDTTDSNDKLNNYIIPVSSYTLGTGYIESGDTSLTFPVQLSKCTAPTSFVLAPDVFNGDDGFTFTWSGAEGGTNNAIVGYECQARVSYDGEEWEEWGSSGITIPGQKAYYTDYPGGISVQYRIRTKGSAGEDWYSPWLESNVVVKEDDPWVYIGNDAGAMGRHLMHIHNGAGFDERYMPYVFDGTSWQRYS